MPEQKVAGPKKLQTLAQNHAEAAVKALAAVMADDTAPAPARISAANTLLQWGYGKPGALAGDGDKTPVTEQIIRLCWGPEPG